MTGRYLHNRQRVVWHTRCIRGCSSERGGPLVEVAVSLPIFIAIIVAGTALALVCYDAIEVSSAARAGVQYGMQNHTTAMDLAGMQTAAKNNAPNVHGITATATYFCQCSNNVGSATPTYYASCPSSVATTCGSNRVIEYVQVRTSATVNTGMLVPSFHFLPNLPSLPTTYTVTGKAVMRVQE